MKGVGTLAREDNKGHLVRRDEKAENVYKKSVKTAKMAAESLKGQHFSSGIRFDNILSVPRKQSCQATIGATVRTAKQRQVKQ